MEHSHAHMHLAWFTYAHHHVSHGCFCTAQKLQYYDSAFIDVCMFEGFDNILYNAYFDFFSPSSVFLDELFLHTHTHVIYISPWYNRNAWLGVKHQVTNTHTLFSEIFYKSECFHGYMICIFFHSHIHTVAKVYEKMVERMKHVEFQNYF